MMTNMTMKVFFLAVVLALASAAHAAAPARYAGKIAQIFVPEMIDVNVAYFERVAGVAKNINDDSRVYKIDGCEVTANVSKQTVRSLRMELGPRCTFNLNKFFYGNFRFLSPDKMTFGDFEAAIDGGGRFYADCLYSCGNAYQPSVYELWYSPHSTQFIEAMVEVKLVSLPAITASMAWESTMRKEQGGDWIIMNKFNCTSRYDAVARRVFRNVKISAITIGYDVLPVRC